jgi:prepilin-type N-terminal cleavage/methylation domain-containing protein
MKPVAYAPGSDSRPAFTLVEMLVVVSILLIITVAVVAVAPRFTDDRKLARAADQMAQILLTVKQRAKRDLVPTGVRLYPDPQHNGLVTRLQYIQQPDDFSPAAVPGSTPVPGPSTVTLGYTANSNVFAIASANPQVTSWSPANWPAAAWTGSVLVASSLNPTTGLPTVDFTGGYGDWTLWPVQPGDYLKVKGVCHLILLVSPSTLVLAPVAPFQPLTSISGLSGTSTLQIAAVGNAAQITPGMIVTAPWGSATNTTTIRSVNNTTMPMSITLSAAPSGGGDVIGFLPAVTSQPTTYSVIRRPRILQGETPLDLPAGICIDPNAKYTGDPYSFSVGTAAAPQPRDILFSPQGNVMNTDLASGQDAVIFWVRDYTKDVTYPAASWPPAGSPGDQFLILIQTHTGFIAEHPVNTNPGGDPYSFTKDAQTSGL